LRAAKTSFTALFDELDTLDLLQDKESLLLLPLDGGNDEDDGLDNALQRGDDDGEGLRVELLMD